MQTTPCRLFRPLAAAALLSLALAAGAAEPKNVLLLNSYHQGYQWTDDQTRGAVAALRSRGNVKIHIEYMGTKWTTGKDYLEQLRRTYQLKFQKLKFDILVATDNDAFDFLKLYRDELFGKVPTVFCGVNYFKPEDLRGYELFTGLNETADFRAGLDLALKLHPNTRRIAVVTDLSGSGKKIREEFEEVVPAYRNRVQFEFLDDLDVEALLSRVAHLPQDSLVFFFVFSRDRSGRIFEYDESPALVSRASPVPVYGSWDFSLGHGIVGGMLTNGFDQGRVAGEIAARILDGERVEQIPVVMASPSRYMFDYRQMKRFGISRSALPKGSTIINEPPSFYRVNKELVWGVIGSLVGLGVVVASLLLTIARRKRAEEALREREARYRTLVNNVNLGIIRTTPGHAGHFLQVNPAMAKMLGYATAEEMMQIAVGDLYQNREDRLRLFEHLQAKGFVKDYLLPMMRKDGTPILASLTATVQYDERGAVRWLDGIIEDVTGQKQLQQELLKSQKLKSVGLLAGGIAHDFNNLLTAVLGNISLAKSLPPQQSEVWSAALKDAETASLRAKDLTGKLLTFAKGGAPIRRAIPIGATVRTSASLALSGSKSRCEFDIPPDLWMVDADEVQIGQVVSNLAVNADQAMPSGGTLRISCRNRLLRETDAPLLPAGRYVQIVVQDEGVGIPEKMLGQIFDPYFTTKELGGGLGLSISYSIVKGHGGHIGVESKAGEGSTFTVHLPASDSTTAVPVSHEKPVVRGSGRVLVVDDEEAVRQTARRMLTGIGYQVECARDGTEAVALYSEALHSGRPFDAVIIDLTIPGGRGGKEAVRRLAEIDPDVKAIVSSGYSYDPIMSEFRSFGFCGVLTKPYKLEDLSGALHETLAAQS